MAGRRYLVDTNIFVEILLHQNKEVDCTRFVFNNFDEITISQFSLQSIAIICFRTKAMPVFTKFLTDFVNRIEVVTLNSIQLKDIENIMQVSNLDYDDAYQLKAARARNFEIVTMDKDFLRVSSLHKIVFI